MAPSNQNSGSELFIDRLYNENLIARKVFAFSLGGTDEKSSIEFGEYDVEKHSRPGSSISWNAL